MSRPRTSVNKDTRLWRTLATTLAVTLSLVGTMATRAHAAAALAEVLILGPTVPLGINSLEYKIITGSTSVTIPSVGLTGLGKSAYIATSASDWLTQLAANPPYKAIVLGDPNCAQSTTVPVAWASTAAAASALATAATGNVVIIGTDPTVHPGSGGTRGAQLWKSAIGFALADFATDGTGAVIALSCYYDYGGAPTPTLVPVLSGFGIFMTQQTSCGVTSANTVAIVAIHPALAGLSSTSLSNWSCSVHEGFTSWPTSSFMPLAVATDTTLPASLLNFTAADGTKGFPYILARGRTLTPVAGGLLKVCKVADLGVAVGTSFSFTAGSSTFTVPAGPAPGGTCVVGPTFTVGSTVTVAETIPPGHVVSSITVAPPSQLVGTPNLAAGSVNITIGSGVTEVTFTDKRTGFIEICKNGHVRGNFTFTVNPGGLGPFVVPAGACSPAIEVAAGSVMIQEMPTTGTTMFGCSTIPAGNQVACNTVAQTSTVTVVPGNVSAMTIAFVTNRPTIDHIGAIDHAIITLACAPNPARLGQPVTCTAKVKAVESKIGTPTGAVSFMEGSTLLAAVQLSADGTAAFTISTLVVGTHAIVVSYSGDENFEQSASQQFNVAIERP